MWLVSGSKFVELYTQNFWMIFSLHIQASIKLIHLNETTMIWSFATRRQIDVPLAEEFRDVPDVFNELVLRLLPRYSRSERMCQNLFTPHKIAFFTLFWILSSALTICSNPLLAHTNSSSSRYILRGNYWVKLLSRPGLFFCIIGCHHLFHQEDGQRPRKEAGGDRARAAHHLPRLRPPPLPLPRPLRRAGDRPQNRRADCETSARQRSQRSAQVGSSTDLGPVWFPGAPCQGAPGPVWGQQVPPQRPAGRVHQAGADQPQLHQILRPHLAFCHSLLAKHGLHTS